MIANLKNFILDTLFPITCLGCGAPDQWLCEKCLAGIKNISRQVCPYCEKVFTDSGTFCPACLARFHKKNKNPSLDGMIVSAKYKDVSFLIHKYKYAFAKDLSFVLGKIISGSLGQNGAPLPDAIIPVPLHGRRKRWRGFNQSELLAEYIGKNLLPNFPLPVLNDILVRKKYSRPQMRIKDHSARKKNITSAFALSKDFSPCRIEEKNILLVDDVATTGATLFECARVLKSAGAKKVFAAVIARQEFKIKS